jgi:hypothetical protein
MARDPIDRTDQQEHPRDAIAAFALGVLEPDERAGIEAHLAGCAACRDELARHEAVVGELGFAARPAPPRPELRAKVLADLARDDAAPRPRRFPLPTLALAAAALIAIVSIVVLAVMLARAVDERDDARLGEHEIAEYLSNGGTLSPLVPAPDAADDARAGHGSLAVGPSQDQAMLVVYGLPPSGDGHGYMAWAEGDDGRIRLGELSVDEQGVGWLVLQPPDPMTAYDTVGINRISPDAPDGEPFLVASVR